VVVEDFQQGPGAQGGLMTQASQGGDGGSAVAQEGSEEAAGDRQANAFGLGGGSELGQQVGGADDGLAQLDLGPPQTGLQVGDLLLQPGQRLPDRRGVEVAEDGVGFAVEPLAADAAVDGVTGDLAACSEEDQGGAGKAIGDGYDAHG
jgi:hypothetical protein